MKGFIHFRFEKIIELCVGTLLLCFLFMYIKIPSGISNTYMESAYGVGAFCAILYGPIIGGLIVFFGEVLSDYFLYGSVWWSLSVASGMMCFAVGLLFSKVMVRSVHSLREKLFCFNLVQIFANLVAWILIAPIFDVTVYAQSVEVVLLEGCVSTVMNAVSCGVIGSVIIVFYCRFVQQSLKREHTLTKCASSALVK